MYDKSITIYNLHDGEWHPTVISGVSLYTVTASEITVNGVNNVGSVEALIPSDQWGRAGGAVYIPPKAYAQLADVTGYFTFTPEQDVLMEGEYTTIEDDEDFDMGFYHEMNNTRDGVFLIKAAEFLTMIPHFEVTAR